MDQASNLTDLFLLVRVIDAGGFSAAAARMGTTRSLLSRRIIELERRLGVRLLHRNARQFAVTAIGERVYRHAVAMCEAADAAERAAESAGVASGLVRIATHGLLTSLVTDLLPGFSVGYPQIRLAVNPGGGDVEALLRQQVDIVLGMGDTLPDSADIVARPLGSIRLVMVGSPDLWQRLGCPSHPDQLEDHHCLSYAGTDMPSGWSFRGMPPRRRQPRLATTDLSSLRASARAGLGFAQLPLYACRDDLADGHLCLAFEAFEMPPLPLHALTMQGNAVSEAALGFIRFTRAHLAAAHDHAVMPAA
jgi:DNA-binding transcriptional LysR family regulator